MNVHDKIFTTHAHDYIERETQNLLNIKYIKNMKTTLTLVLFSLISFSTFSQRWITKGNSLYGIDEYDYLGNSVSLNQNADILAVSASEFGHGKGYAQVYRWTGSNWTKKGNTFQGDSIYDLFGSSVSLNGNGNILSIGIPYEGPKGIAKVYYWNINEWTQKGSDIVGKNNGEAFGTSTCLSKDGNTVAIGGIQNTQNDSVPGVVRIYNWNGSEWVQKGSDIYGEAPRDEFGYALSWNDSASILAIGAWYMDIGAKFNAGQVRVYKWNGSEWSQIGSDIEGEAGYYTGISVSLDSTGNTLGVGSSGYNTTTGMAAIYSWNGTDWELKGDNIYGNPSEYFGGNLRLTSDGEKIAICESNEINIFSWNSSEWINDGGTISSRNSAISFTGDGKLIAIGNDYNMTNGSNSGAAMVYKLCYDSYDTIAVSECEYYTAPSGKILDTSGAFNDTVANATGCDSIITINLTINNPTDTAFSIATCQSYTSPSGKLFTEDSIFTDTILNSFGCDSIMTIDLTIFETAYDTTTLTKCVSYRSPSGKYMWTESGTYTDTVITAKGCDSIVTTHLTINKVDTSVLVTETELTANANFAAYQWINCNNNYSKIDGATYQSFTPSTNGWYAVEITSQNGCVDTSGCFGIGTSDIQVNDFGNDFNVYPNPTSGNISIELGKTYHDVILSLKNLDGKKINTLKAGTCNRVEYTIQSPPGTYLLEIKAGENKKATVKIIKH